MKNVFMATLALGLGFCLGGCGSSTPPQSPDTAHNESGDHHDHDHGDHDHHDHAAAPKSFGEAVSKIAELHAAIGTAMAAGDTKKADGPVHELGHFLESLPKLAEQAELEAEQQEAVKTAQATLFEAFGDLDRTIHGKSDGKSWDDVSEEIKQAISSLQSLTGEAKKESP